VFHGFAKDVAAVVSAFDLSVFPSLWEGTPLTVFEALAMGKPILATDADGLLDVLTDGHDAMIVPKRDAPALAAGIVRLMDDPALRARLGRQAAVTAQQYDIAAFVRKMERLYDILHRVSRPTRRRGVLNEDLSFLETRVPDGR
jgi:glycosyltransferase involved in cell wall biosynthesis